jgi:sporulation protein YlmC with PRC-barrel domain
MTGREVRVELLLGRRVVDSEGGAVGRLEEVVADYIDDEYVVREFHVGAFAAFERLGGGMLGRGFLRLIGGHRIYHGYVVPWRFMELSDPDHPRVTVPKADLARIDATRHPSSVRPATPPPSRPRRSA